MRNGPGIAQRLAFSSPNRKNKFLSPTNNTASVVLALRREMKAKIKQIPKGPIFQTSDAEFTCFSGDRRTISSVFVGRPLRINPLRSQNLGSV